MFVASVGHLTPNTCAACSACAAWRACPSLGTCAACSAWRACPPCRCTVCRWLPDATRAMRRDLGDCVDDDVPAQHTAPTLWGHQDYLRALSLLCSLAGASKQSSAARGWSNTLCQFWDLSSAATRALRGLSMAEPQQQQHKHSPSGHTSSIKCSSRERMQAIFLFPKGLNSFMGPVGPLWTIRRRYHEYRAPKAPKT